MVEVPKRFRFIGQGVYTLAEAGRLTGVPVRNLRRWARGYSYMYAGKRNFSPPIIGTGVRERTREPILEFRDIIEIRFLGAFRKLGVTWNVIRRVAAKVHAHIKSTHPFATKLFRTDGRTILMEIIGRDRVEHRLVDLLREQYEWDSLIAPYLHQEKVEFSDTQDPVRWWPLGPNRYVVVDPLRAFGAPIIASRGIQTYLVAQAALLERDRDFVAGWYGIDPPAVDAAVDFESGLRAAT